MSKDKEDGVEILDRLYQVIESRRDADPKESRTARLFDRGVNKIAQKVGEEATEIVIAALSESDERVVSECADLIYHLMVLLAARKITPAQVYAELGERARAS